MNRLQKEAFLSEVAVISPTDESEAMKLNYVVDGNVYAVGEESDEVYVIDVDDVDFENSIFYKLEKMNIPD